jgi:hypothetical protein
LIPQQPRETERLNLEAAQEDVSLNSSRERGTDGPLRSVSTDLTFRRSDSMFPELFRRFGKSAFSILVDIGPKVDCILLFDFFRAITLYVLKSIDGKLCFRGF